MNTKVYSQIKDKINEADAILIGAGAGLSTSAGVNYGTFHFKETFKELVKEYGFTDMYTSSFYDFKTEEERWSYWAKHINYLCISKETSDTYLKLYNLVKDKNYFVLTTNVDRQFIKAGFDESKVFEIQGTLTKIQCSKACHDKLYDNTNMVKEMLEKNEGVHIPSELVPTCPICHGKMEVNLRKDAFFVEDENWHIHEDAYEKFINDYKDKKIVLIELGAGFNTPGIIRYPFEELTNQLKKAFLIRINDKFANVPNDIQDKAVGVQADIHEVLESLEEKS
jgi:NAD-dependent SIR2 family protein deacetylase